MTPLCPPALPRSRASTPALRRVAALQDPHGFYQPPYERPLDDEFAWHLVKYLAPISGLQYQVRIETACLPLWVPFVLEQGAYRVGFICGEMDGTPADAQAQDALLLGSGHLDVVYRFRAHDLLHRLPDCLLAVARWDPRLFSQRGLTNLEILASPTARTALSPLPDQVQAHIGGCNTAQADDPMPEDMVPDVLVRRLSVDHPAAWQTTYEAIRDSFHPSQTDSVPA